jgi:WS/DGAT/MGAT family acyltransferase
MHTLKVAVFDPEAQGVSYGYERAKQQLAERLSLFPAFRRRLVELPLGFHHPVWIEDADFDLDDHVHRMTLPAPGGRLELDAAISSIASRPLDRRRPLWEVWILEGFEGGRVAGVAKIHHAVADGVAAAELLAHVMSPAPDSVALPAPEDDWVPDPLPSDGQLVRDALRDHASQVRGLPGLVQRTVENLVVVGRRRREEALHPPVPMLDTPRTLFNTSLTPRRSFASTEIPLDAVKAVKKRFGTTLNDVLLALVAGSIRGYLARRDALPEQPLVACVPVSTDPTGAAPRLWGNRVSNLFTSLRTDLDDPAERLQGIHRVTVAAKDAHRLMGADMYHEWSEFQPPALVSGSMRWFSRRRLADRLHPAANVIVSSVPGPRRPLYWVGHRLRDIYSVGPILEGMGLNVTLWSYVDRIYVGALACPDRVDGLEELTEGIARELDALLGARAAG